MKWGKKKPPPSSPSTSSRLSFISNVLPSSWLTKFKRMSINSGQDTPNSKLRGKRNSVYWSPLRCPNDRGVGGGGEGEGFHGGEDDAFWRLSFREEIVEGQNSTGSVLRSVWYHNHSQDEPKLQKPSSCQGRVNIREDDKVPKFSDMVPDVRASRGLPREMEIFPENDADIREKVVEIRTPRLRIERGKKLTKKTQRGNFSENQLQSDSELYKENASEMEPGTKGGGHGYIIQREDCNLAGSDAGDSLNAELWEVKEKNELIAQKESDGLHEGKTLPEWQKWKEMKIEEIKQRKSLYISREATERKRPKQKTIKVKSYSPRLASKTEACKIRALEEMKRTRSKSTKKREKSKDMGLDSFAVVKTSLDPQKDFRDSMMEMIKERGISQAEELEELLACYLKLNCDEYHELIIKVFRQVWLDLNQTCNISEAENENCCYD